MMKDAVCHANKEGGEKGDVQGFAPPKHELTPNEVSPTALYRHFDADGVLLYVGITGNPKRRLYEHKCRSRWAEQIDRVTVKWMPDLATARDAERIAIAKEGPLFNGGEGPRIEPTGDALRDWMAASGITQEEIARQYGVTRSTASKIINGHSKAPLHFVLFIEDWSDGEVPPRYWLFGANLELHKSSKGFPQ